MRLNKFISESGVCSRREADRFIEEGVVFINGKKAKIGDQVNKGDKVTVNGKKLDPRTEADNIFIAFNKPPGITTTTETSTPGNIIDYVNHSQRVFPIGRLDKDSQGLIFLTNNGDIVNKILRAGNQHEKEYVVTVNKPITEQFVKGMEGGVPMLGTVTRKCKVLKEAPNVFRIVLIQGLNRQIRRMCEYFGYEVLKLERVRIMNINLKGIPLGDWRELTEKEVKELYQMSSDSISGPDRKRMKTEREYLRREREWKYGKGKKEEGTDETSEKEPARERTKSKGRNRNLKKKARLEDELILDKPAPSKTKEPTKPKTRVRPPKKKRNSGIEILDVPKQKPEKRRSPAPEKERAPRKGGSRKETESAPGRYKGTETRRDEMFKKNREKSRSPYGRPPGKGGSSRPSSRPGKPEGKPARSTGKPERTARPERSAKPERTGRPSGKPSRSGSKPERGGKSVKPRRTGRK